jgi:hypothetical protein
MADREANFPLLSTRGKFYAALHHVLLAMTIASATVLAAQTRWFAPFDLTTRSLMTYFQAWKDVRVRQEKSSQGYEMKWMPSAAGDRPLVIIVSRLPAQAAAMRLDPAQFAAHLIRGAVQQSPAILALQLDSLDPYWDDPRLNDPTCDFLLAPEYKISEAAAIPDACRSPTGDTAFAVDSLRHASAARSILKQVLMEAAKSTFVVVKAARLPLSVDAFNDLKYSKNVFQQRVALRSLVWTLELCQIPNLHIAYDWESEENGLVFERGIPSLGNVVYEVHRQARSKVRPPGFQYVAETDIDPGMDACAPFRASASARLIGFFSEPREIESEATSFFHKIESMTVASGFGSIGTINGRYHETLVHGTYLDIGNLRPGERIGDLIPRGLQNRVVFLGDDAVRANLLQMKGQPEVDFQAAVYYSNLHSTIGLKHVSAFLLDVALGSLLGGLFAWSWGLYGRMRTAMDRQSAKSVRGILAKAPFYAVARGVLLANLVLIVFLTWGVFVLANYFLRKDVWINPLPLLLGMSLKGLLASRQAASEREAHDWWTFYNQHPDVIFQIPIIILSIAVVLYFGQ